MVQKNDQEERERVQEEEERHQHNVMEEENQVESFPSSMARSVKMTRWCSIADDKEDGPSFSEVMVRNKAFQDWAEASVHNEDTRKWFERIIVCETKEDEVWFDGLCQRINQKLITMLLGAWEQDKPFFGKIINMLQTPDMDGILEEGTSLGERMGIVSLVLVLTEEMERRQRTGLCELLRRLRKKNMVGFALGEKILKGDEDEDDRHRKDVNKLFGWAIFSVRKLKQNQSFQLKRDGGDDTLVEKEIQFLKSMTFRKN